MPLARPVLRPLPFHPRPCPGRPVPLRRAYLAALAVLQVAIAVHAAPVLVPPMSRLTAYAAFHGGGAGALLLVLTALAAIGAAIALAFPALALARHLRRGDRRFAGVPIAAAALATAGAAVLLVGAAALAVAGSLPPEWRTLAVHGGRASIAAGFALTAAGALAGELLRRSKGTGWFPVPANRGAPAGGTVRVRQHVTGSPPTA
jgi:hypothetical protein